MHVTFLTAGDSFRIDEYPCGCREVEGDTTIRPWVCPDHRSEPEPQPEGER